MSKLEGILFASLWLLGMGAFLFALQTNSHLVVGGLTIATWLVAIVLWLAVKSENNSGEGE